MVAGGLVLSVHTDVVLVNGQLWTSDTRTLTRRCDWLRGRGACDMKGFLALALAAGPKGTSGRLARSIHLAFSYDEEIRCLGAPAVIADLARCLAILTAVIVGEPTGMEVAGGIRAQPATK